MAFVMTACPYSSNVPLSNPSVKTDEFFFGKWELENEFTDTPEFIKFIKRDRFRFFVEKHEFSDIDGEYKKTITFLCHFTDIDGDRFINAKNDGLFYFYKIEMIDAEKFQLFEVTDNITEVFHKSSDMNEFFKQNKHHSFFYNKNFQIYRKIM
jgi:hypothetical protein